MSAKRMSEEKILVTISAYRWGFVWAGIAGAIIGLLIVVWPSVMGALFSILIGIYALIAGLVFGWIAIRGIEAPIFMRVARGLAGLALVVGAILMFTHVDAATEVMINVVGISLGVLWLFEAFMVFLAIRGRPVGGWVLAYLIAAVIIGVLLLFTPAWGSWGFRWLLGLGLLIFGVAQAVRGFTAEPAVVVDVQDETDG